ncbi:MAG TPA: TonB-dependent receptor [Steroidobacter sp.]|uniref:TonB-dependent receptor plug domain-containing protein n=1 Tax=Steroidobacter sp. TaxID=1978227 RepID=UPI002EDA3010
MGNKNSGPPTLAGRLQLVLMTACAVGVWAPSALAQQAQDQAVPLEEVVITGSRIKRANYETASPIAALPAEEFKYQGTSTVESVLNRMPQFTADSNENGSNGSDGTARVNLRNLGSSRVLVLIDGQRMLPVETADVNFIPSALVERVDVVTGGASAVYGSDAVAGVVNFILNKNLDGVRISAQYGSAWHRNDNKYAREVVENANYELADSSVWDGGRADFNVAMGLNSADGKGNATLYFGYRKLDPVTQDARDYSACGLNLGGEANDALVCGGSSNNQWGSFVMLGGPNNGRTFNNTKDGAATWVPYDSSFLYNYAPTNYIQRSDKRITAGGFAHYDYNEHMNLYGSLMFMDDHTFSQAAPSAYFQGNVYPINCDNPLMSAQQASILCGAAAGTPTNVNTFIGYRFAGAGGARRDDLRHTDYRLNVGSRGEIASGWSYDASFLYSTVVYDESYKNDLDLVKGARALQVVNVDGVPTCRSVVDGTDPSCVPANVFTAFGISDEAYGYMLSPTFTHGVQTQRVANVYVNGDLEQYGLRSPFAAGGIAIATGAEYRTEELTFEADALAQLKGTQENAGDFDVRELFIEADVPLVSDKPGVDELAIALGYRYSDYSIAGGTSFTADTYKFELRYAPAPSFKLRGSYNRAVRAPNISELFAAQALGNVSAQDPCSGADPSASLEDCMRSGVTQAQYGLIPECPADTCVTLGGGNLALQPEIADTITGGFVFTPTFLPGFAFSADYFDIFVDGYIGAVDAPTVINQCIQTGSQFFCDLFHRDPASGVLFGTNGYIEATNQNTGYLQTSGIDFTSTYDFDLGSLLPGAPDLGSFNVAFVGTSLNSRRIEQLPGLGSYNCVGLFGPTCGQPTPKWRHNVRLTWTSPQRSTTVSANWRYFGSALLSSNSSNEFLQGDPVSVNRRIAGYSYMDLAATWRFVDSVEFRAGINNVFDRDPPMIAAGLLSSFGNGNTYPGVYDPMGRLVYFGMTVEF